MVFNIIILVIFFINSYLKMNTTFFDQGLEVQDRQKIIRNYRENVFIYDLLVYLSLGSLLIF